MKLFAAVFFVFSLASCEAFKSLPPVKANVCYTTADGSRVCVGSDGTGAVTIDGEFSGK